MQKNMLINIVKLFGVDISRFSNNLRQLIPIVIVLYLVLPGMVKAKELDKQIYGELEIERSADKNNSRINIYIVNNSENVIELVTGSNGGPGKNDDRHTDAVGTGITALPALIFQTDNEEQIKIVPPLLSNGITYRHMWPYVLSIAPKTRVLYYSFEIKSEQFNYKFIEGAIHFKDGFKYDKGEKRAILARDIPIIRMVQTI